MTTSYQFDEQDFNGCGQMIIKNKSGLSITLAYKVGYMPTTSQKYLISLADGMIIPFVDLKALVAYVNKGDFRPMSKQEIAKILPQQGNRFLK